MGSVAPYFGNVGINDTTPDYKLDVNGTFRATDLSVLAMAAASKVGIGTIIPQAKLHLVDGSFTQDTPANPTPMPIPSWTLPASAWKIFVSGRYAYVTFTNSTLTPSSQFRIIDVSNPGSPQIIGGTTIYASDGVTPTALPFDARGIFVSGRYAYLTFAVAGNDGFRVLDISNPVKPTVVGIGPADFPGISSNIFVSGRYAYIVFGTSPAFKIVDVSNPVSPFIVNTSPLTGLPANIAYDLFVSGNYAYVAFTGASGNNSLRVIDVSSPASPVVLGGSGLTSLPNNARDVFVSGRYAYMVFANSVGTNRFRIIDISDTSVAGLTNSKIVGGIGLALPAEPFEVFVAGRYAYVTLVQSGGGTNIFRIIDVASPTSPFVPENCGGCNLTLPDNERGGIFVAGRYAYLVLPEDTGGSGVSAFRIIDITGIEAVSASIHSLEAGSLQARESATVSDHLSVGGSLTVGLQGILSRGAVGGPNLFIKSSNGIGGVRLFTTSVSDTTACNNGTICGSGPTDCIAAFLLSTGAATSCGNNTPNRRCLCAAYGN